MVEELLSVKEVAAEIGVPVLKVQGWIRKGWLPHVLVDADRKGFSWRWKQGIRHVRRSDLREFRAKWAESLAKPRFRINGDGRMGRPRKPKVPAVRPPKPPCPYLKQDEAAKLAGCSKTWIYLLVARGLIPTVPAGIGEKRAAGLTVRARKKLILRDTFEGLLAEGGLPKARWGRRKKVADITPV